VSKRLEHWVRSSPVSGQRRPLADSLSVGMLRTCKGVPRINRGCRNVGLLWQRFVDSGSEEGEYIV
jgi:hypothetical protein